MWGEAFTPTDLDIVFTKPTKKGEFAKTNISPKRKTSVLSSSEENIKKIVDSVPDMMKEVKELPFDALEKIIDAWVNSNMVAAHDEGETAPASTETSIDEVFKEINES